MSGFCKSNHIWRLLLLCIATALTACGNGTDEQATPNTIVGWSDGVVPVDAQSTFDDQPAADAQPPVALSLTDDPLVWSDDFGTNVWAESIIVVDGDRTFNLPLDETQGIGRRAGTVELRWETEDDIAVSVHFYMASDETHWWAHQIRSKVRYPENDKDWVYYPGEFFNDTDAGRYMKSPLGVSYQGELDLETIQITGLRFEGFTAEHPVDPSSDLGVRSIREKWTKPTRTYRFEANHALLDVDEVIYTVNGQRVPAVGSIDTAYSGVLVESGDGQEIEAIFRSPRADEPQEVASVACSDDCPEPNDEWLNPPSSFMLYFRTDGIDWWVYRSWVSIEGERIVDNEGLEEMRTPLGEVFEGDLTLPGLELRNVRLELSGCTGERRGLRNYEQCDLGPDFQDQSN